MRTEIDRKKSSFGNYDIGVVKYNSKVLDEELMMMLEIPDGKDIQSASHAFSISRTGDGMFDRPLPPMEMLTSLVMPYTGRGKQIVIGGLGSGLLHSTLLKRNTGTLITSVEPDKAVIEMARVHWGFAGRIKHDIFERAYMSFGKVDCFVLNMQSDTLNINARDVCGEQFLGQLMMYVNRGGSIIINGGSFAKLFDDSKIPLLRQVVHTKADELNGERIKYIELIRR